jgi:hypothetical protein
MMNIRFTLRLRMSAFALQRARILTASEKMGERVHLLAH